MHCIFIMFIQICDWHCEPLVCLPEKRCFDFEHPVNNIFAHSWHELKEGMTEFNHEV